MTTLSFQPKQNYVEALLDKIYVIKFSRHVPLTVVLLSAIYAVYRSQHYLSSAFNLPGYISWPTSVFIELLVIGASASAFIAFRESYVTELKDQDTTISRVGVCIAVGSLAVAFIALLGVACADAWLVTGDYVATFLMTLAQLVQALFIVNFIVNSLLDERSNLRQEYAEYMCVEKEKQEQNQVSTAQFNANHCPHCRTPVSPNNRRRHMLNCSSKPTP